MARHPYCHWCGCRVYEHPFRRGKPVPGDQATIDHVNSRNRPGPRPWIGRWVLSCRKCNEERAAAEVAATPAEELWRASGRYPQGVPAGAAEPDVNQLAARIVAVAAAKGWRVTRQGGGG